MNKPTKIILGLVILALVGWGISRSTAKKEVSTTKEPVKIGVIAPLTGVVAQYGDQLKKGVEAAADPSVQFVFEDDRCEPKDAISAFRKLTDIDKVDFIIGPACGSPQDALAPLLKGSSKLMIVPSAASQSLFSESGGNLYNMQYSLEQEAAFIADQMYAKGYTKVALISYQNQFSKVETDSFKANFKGRVVHDIVYTTGTSDVQTELTKIKQKDYDAVFVADISFYFANGLDKLHNFGINVPVFSPYPVELPAVRTLVEGVYYAFPKDITDGQGGVYGISKQSAELRIKAVGTCGNNAACVKDIVKKDGFDANGIKQRSLVLKQIKNAEPIVVAQ